MTLCRKDGTNILCKKINLLDKVHMKTTSIFIIVGLVTGLLSLVMTTRQYIGVLLQGESSTHTVILHFNRHGELYWDGIALIGLLFFSSFALVLYLKECKEKMPSE